MAWIKGGIALAGLETTLVFDITMILQVVLIDLALGGDNSIVIGMAAKNLPAHLQKKAILYGTAGAIILRFIMAFIVSWLFQVPFFEDTRRRPARFHWHQAHRSR